MIYWQRLGDYRSAADYYRLALSKRDAPAYLERFVGYALDRAGDKAAALEYFRELRRSMGEPPDPARRPEVIDREIRRLESETGQPRGKDRL